MHTEDGTRCDQHTEDGTRFDKHPQDSTGLGGLDQDDTGFDGIGLSSLDQHTQDDTRLGDLDQYGDITVRDYGALCMVSLMNLWHNTCRCWFVLAGLSHIYMN